VSPTAFRLTGLHSLLRAKPSPFVFSGFLITTIIIQELAKGGLSLAGFYER
jgi:hypothetical protein